MTQDDNPSAATTSPEEAAATSRRPSRRRAASRPAGPPVIRFEAATSQETAPANISEPSSPPGQGGDGAPTPVTTGSSDSQPGEEPNPVAEPAAAPRARRSRGRRTASSPDDAQPSDEQAGDSVRVSAQNPGADPPALIFQPPQPPPQPAGAPASSGDPAADSDAAPRDFGEPATDSTASVSDAAEASDSNAGGEEGTSSRRRRSRGGRSRRRPSSSGADSADDAGEASTDSSADTSAPTEPNAAAAQSAAESSDSEESGGASPRRRRRRRGGDSTDSAADKDGSSTDTESSTRVTAKKQRRRDGRESGRRRAPILTEAEFLARRESVERVMAIRQRGEATQIAVLEDDMLVEHYVAIESQTSLIGNVYMGRVQNVLPSMEAAFIDIGKGRNAVLYAGEVDWGLRGDLNQPRRIENALKSGQTVMVQVTKDPVGHKGARLTSQISLPGRFLVYVPGGGTSGISRKLPDTERNRLKAALKDLVPEEAGVIIRTAAEGATEDELQRDVARLTARWDDIEKKAKNGQAPQLLYGEPDTTIKVVRDLFTEDFSKLVVSGEDAWYLVDNYVSHVAPDLADRLERDTDDEKDLFDRYRIGEQIAKALERKVWLPSGGSLVFDRAEAMTVVDVNTGRFTGAGGNLEETVTKNNLEAAEELVRQLRLRDIGGIIVIDFIDMVLEDNRDQVLRRLVECLARDRTRHQVAEVTSLGLVQMTRKRIGTGLLEGFSKPCEHCHGRGAIIQSEPVVNDRSNSNGADRIGRDRSRSSRSRKSNAGSNGSSGGEEDASSGADESGTAATAETDAELAQASADSSQQPVGSQQPVAPPADAPPAEAANGGTDSMALTGADPVP